MRKDQLYSLDSPDNKFEGTGLSMSTSNRIPTAPPTRTLRRMYSDKAEYRNYEFLHGVEDAPASYMPRSDNRTTLFYKGFYRKKVEGQVEARQAKEDSKEQSSMLKGGLRRSCLAELTKHNFLTDGPHEQYYGRKHFNEVSSIIMGGPESVHPLAPSMETKRMQTMVSGGLTKKVDGIQDVFKDFGYSAKDISNGQD